MSNRDDSAPRGRDATVQRVDKLVALYHQAVDVAVRVAELAEDEAQNAARLGDLERAQSARARAIRTRRAADAGRYAARRLHVRHEATQIFGAARPWDSYLSHGAGDLSPAPLEIAAAMIGTDLAGNVRLWNGAAERLYGWARSEALGRPIGALTVGPDDADIAARIINDVRERGSWEGEFWVCREDRTRFLAYVHDALVRDLDGRPVGVVGVSLDVQPGVLIEVPATGNSAWSND